MTLEKKGRYWYGTGPEDVQAELVAYSKRNRYEAVRFAQALCACGSPSFRLETDEDEGAGRRTCARCGTVHLMGDSDVLAGEANFERHECICDAQEFELLSGVALYADSNDVRWYYVGCRCTQCNLVGVFADWKCEAGDAASFLAKT